MNVFTDYHHGDLYHSLHLLFEKRLGWNLYRPIGTDWANRGFWRYSDNPATIEQYLGFEPGTREEDGVYFIPDTNHGTVHKAITPEKFISMDIDIVIASVWNHQRSFAEMAAHKPNCKFICQEGNNMGIVDFGVVKNLMASTSEMPVPDGVNAIFYHQEFDRSIFHPSSQRPPLRITSLMNCYPDGIDFPLWEKYKQALPEFEFKMHGILGTDGIIDGLENIAKAIHNSTFIWHLKAQGDGFGHTIHNSYACGRSVITKFGYYANRLAEPLLKDGDTAIDLDARSFEENVVLIRHLAARDQWGPMHVRTWHRFQDVVNFNAEFEEIKKFLERLI
jgi:hypothetical protein